MRFSKKKGVDCQPAYLADTAEQEVLGGVGHAPFIRYSTDNYAGHRDVLLAPG